MSRQHTLTLNSAFAAPAPAAVREKTIAALKMIAAGCGIAVLQVLLIPLVRHIGLAQAQMTLFQWDSGWYANVAKYGYHFGYAPAFFPGYPVLINAVRDLTGLSLVSSMLLISQSFAALFWTYVVALLVRLRVPTAGRWVVVALLLAHPGAFFQVAAYSESLFLANMLGFMYWNLEHRRACALPLMILHGVAMSATKLIAMPIVLLPLVLALWRRSRGERASLGGASADSLLAAVGGLSFLLYCQFALGSWDLYMQYQHAGWNISPDLLFWMHWPPRFLVPEIVLPLLGAEQISRFVTAVTGWFFVAVIAADIVRVARRNRGAQWTERIALYWCALGMFCVLLASFTGLGMPAMVRHVFGVYVLLVLLGAHALRHYWKPSWKCRILPAALVLAMFVIGSAALQYLLISRFTLGSWVA